MSILLKIVDYILNVVSSGLRYPGAPSVGSALDGYACVSGYCHHLASASRHSGSHCLHHPAPDLLRRSGAHFTAAGGF